MRIWTEKEWEERKPLKRKYKHNPRIGDLVIGTTFHQRWSATVGMNERLTNFCIRRKRS